MVKKKIKTKKVSTMSREQKFLITLIKYTERNIKNDDSELDLVFKQQTDKLKKELGALK